MLLRPADLGIRSGLDRILRLLQGRRTRFRLREGQAAVLIKDEADRRKIGFIEIALDCPDITIPVPVPLHQQDAADRRGNIRRAKTPVDLLAAPGFIEMTHQDNRRAGGPGDIGQHGKHGAHPGDAAQIRPLREESLEGINDDQTGAGFRDNLAKLRLGQGDMVLCFAAVGETGGIAPGAQEAPEAGIGDLVLIGEIKGRGGFHRIRRKELSLPQGRRQLSTGEARRHRQDQRRFAFAAVAFQDGDLSKGNQRLPEPAELGDFGIVSPANNGYLAFLLCFMYDASSLHSHYKLRFVSCQLYI